MVRLYTMDGCGFCVKLKGLLDRDGIEYEEVDIYKNEEEFNAVVKKTGEESVPTIKIDKQIFAPDVSFDSIEEALGLIKRFNV